MYKNRLMVRFCILAFCLTSMIGNPHATYADSNIGLGEARRVNYRDKGVLEISIDEVTRYNKRIKEGYNTVSVHCTVKNIDVSAGSNSGITFSKLSSIISLIGADGYEAIYEQETIYGSESDHHFEMNADINIGDKKKIAFFFLVPEGTKTVRVKISTSYIDFERTSGQSKYTPLLSGETNNVVQTENLDDEPKKTEDTNILNENNEKNLEGQDTRVKELEEENEVLRTENETLKGDNETLVAEKEELQEQIGVLQSDNETLSGEKEELAEQIWILQEDNETLSGEKEKLVEQIEVLQSDNETLSGEKEKLVEQIEVLQSDNETLSGEKEKLVEQNGVLQSDNETLSDEKEKLVEQIEVLQNENKTLQTQVDELAAAAPQDNVIELTDEEQVLQNAVSAYWCKFCSSKDPTSFKVISLRSYEDKIIVEYVAKEFDGSYIEYTSLYDPTTDTDEGLGHADEVPDKYVAGAVGVAELDIDKVIEFSQGDKCTRYSLWSGRFISREDATALLSEVATGEEDTVENEEVTEEADAEETQEAEQVELEAPAVELPENVANADTSTEYNDRATVQLVQQALNEAGYNCGTPDGVAGANTKSAITSYETENGLTVNGVITDQLLESLGIADQIAEQAKIEASKAEYSSDYTYDQLARNPDTYKNTKVKFTGKVLQAETGDTCYARVALNNNYDTVLFVTYESDLLSYRLLEDDTITIYGLTSGTFSYEAVSGATITLPWVEADIIELQ